MGKLWDKIKEILFGKKIKMLAEGENTYHYRNDIKDFRQSQRNFEQIPQV